MTFLGRQYGAVRHGEYPYDKGVNALVGAPASRSTASGRLFQAIGGGQGVVTVSDAPRDGLTITGVSARTSGAVITSGVAIFGGGSGVPPLVPDVSAKPFLLTGSDSRLTAALDFYDLTAGRLTGLKNGRDLSKWWANGKNLATEDPALVANAPSFVNLLGHSSGGIELRPQDYITFSGNQVTLSPNATAPYPATVMFPNGLLKQLSTAKSHSVTPPGGYTVYAIVADCTNPTFSTDGQLDFQLLSPPPVSFSATQKLLGFATNNGSGFIGIADASFAPLLRVSSAQVVPITQAISVAPASGYTSSAVAGAPVTITEGTKVLPFPCNMKVTVRGVLRLAAAAGVRLYGGLYLDGILLGQFFDLGLNTTATWDLPAPLGGPYGTSGDRLFFPAGIHTVTIQVFTYAVSTAFTVQSIVWESTQWGVFS